ncbi:methyltransferase domain-containing protein [Heliobacterium chlorum]|uniref:Methyltransferase domain-containing protein n=1 Tax=Heliobacterium chlorum TaxID=2698 RepID=A0ABR7SZ40_HELCL|nr:class I SAM-dependent methyltransferase [Heliobacterium chlorum]MBC9783797.1 methyltransferase domain-containing protein [Heliobacterium chlorum]
MDSSKKNVQLKFNAHAAKYDSQRRQLIPCFDDFYSIALSLCQTETESPRILDIGAGTGLFTSLFAEKYPQGKFTLIDISEKMLDVARKRFGDHPNMTYVVADYTKHSFTEKYDMVISSLSIHHLTDDEKRLLYQRIYSLLKQGGIFVNADQVLGKTSFLETMYMEDWKYKVEHSGLSMEEIKAAYERQKLDKMSTLDDQTDWLRQAGFSDVDCVYKYYNFVVLFARKV